MESEETYGIDLSLVDQNGFTGFGYLTKKYDLNNETGSLHPSLTQEDIEKGQEANQRYFLYQSNKISFSLKFYFCFSSTMGKIKTYLKFAFGLFMTTLTVMVLMMVDTFSDYNMAYKHFRWAILLKMNYDRENQATVVPNAFQVTEI